MYFTQVPPRYFFTSHLTVRTGSKVTDDPVTVCYCFEKTDDMKALRLRGYNSYQGRRILARREAQQMQYIALDAHKRYSLASVERVSGGIVREARLAHSRGAIQQFLAECEPGSPVAIETVGNWYWIVDEIEAAGMTPHLVHARKAKLMMGMINKTDRLDVRGLNQRGTPLAVMITHECPQAGEIWSTLILVNRLSTLYSCHNGLKG